MRTRVSRSADKVRNIVLAHYRNVHLGPRSLTTSFSKDVVVSCMAESFLHKVSKPRAHSLFHKDERPPEGS